VRVVSLESWKVAEAETVLSVEGRVCAIAKRDGDAPPGSRTASSAKGQRRNPGDPAGAVGLVADGAWRKGAPKRPAELRPGVGSTHTDDAAEGNEVCGGKGST
jgi:hypothetical protein